MNETNVNNNIDIEKKYNELLKKGLELTVTSAGKLQIKDGSGNVRGTEDIALCFDFKVPEMIEYVKELNSKSETESGSLVYIDLPLKESDTDSEFDITNADKYVWEGIKFTSDTNRFYVKDKEDRETYTVVLTSSSTADKADAKILKEAFYNSEYNPVLRAKKCLKKCGIRSKADYEQCCEELPATAWKYYKIQAYKCGDKFTWKKIIAQRGEDDEVFKGFVNYEGQFRRLQEFKIEPPANLTNDLKTPALAYIDLEKLDRKYRNKSSKLWDEFLLQRLHSQDYVSIFKAWSYAVIVGKNNSRQEMWLYGNGGTGKSCLCKAFIHGINKLAGKDICLAASKDTGKSNFNSELLNKHLLVYADAKNLKNGMSEFKHNATGGDNIRIEGKGKDASYGEIYLKCLTCSNELPKLDTTDRSQSSRIIVLPFSLTDDELKRYNLMDPEGQLIGSADFQDRLNAEFECYLASCKVHYIKRCPRDSNIDAHEAKEYLESISTSEQDLVEDFVSHYFEIAKREGNNKGGNITLTEFRAKVLAGFEETDPETGVKIYKGIDLDDVYTYLEKKYEFVKRNVWITKGNTPKGLTSKLWKIQIKKAENSVAAPPTEDDIF